MKEIICSCGGGNGKNHILDEDNCLRYHVVDENEIPKNRRRVYNPEWFNEPVWIWDISDYWITEFTLYYQRMYSQDKNGNWSRPKSKESVNSMKEITQEIIDKIKKNERERAECLEDADELYFNTESNHYNDNGTYSYAVNTINKKHDENIKTILN